MSSCVTTRTSNADKHPGARHKALDAKRRPQAEVQAERLAKAKEKSEKLKVQENGKQKAAELEREAREKIAKRTSGERIEPAPVTRTLRSRGGKLGNTAESMWGCSRL